MTTISAPMMPNAVRAHPQGNLTRPPLLSSAVLGMMVFVIVEAMMFTGMISAWSIVKASAPPGMWPPPGQPRLPLEITAINTVVLLLSGVVAWLARSALVRNPGSVAGRRLLVVAALLGAAFVGVQGTEWARLIGEGLTMQASTFGSFFYLIVGAHALHAVGAIGALLWAWRQAAAGRLREGQLGAVLALWTFVVVLWPMLYATVYL